MIGIVVRTLKEPLMTTKMSIPAIDRAYRQALATNRCARSKWLRPALSMADRGGSDLL
jgi:hypothetical protein